MNPLTQTLLVLVFWFIAGSITFPIFVHTHRGRNPWHDEKPGAIATEAVFLIWAWPVLIVSRLLDG